MTEAQPIITIGGIAPTKPENHRMAIVLWAPAGFGKTTLACTLPGKKALLCFDPDGSLSVAHRSDVTVFDLSATAGAMIAEFGRDDPFSLSKALPNFDAIIVDSLTSISDMTLTRGISSTKGATLERPSPGSYGARNNLVNAFVRNVTRMTGAQQKHVCFTAHEGPPQTDDDGHMLGYTMALGGQLPNNVAMRLNEIWAGFEDSKGHKMLICRKARLRDPAKSRMFDTTKEAEFEWKFNPMNWDDPNNITLAKLFEKWKANGFQKLPLPKG